MTEAVLLRVPCPDRACARRLGQAAVAAHLAACVNLSEIESIYRWQGEVAQDPETLALFKTTRAHIPKLCALITAEHPYDLPAITWMPVNATAETASWLHAETTAP